MKDLVIPLVVMVLCGILIAIGYSKLDVKHRPGVNACSGECYDDWVLADKRTLSHSDRKFG